jgi:hypothetical protein
MQRRGSGRQHRRGERGGTRLFLIVVLLVCLGVATFFALGGDVDSDVTKGNVDISTPKGDIDVNAPDIDVEEPDVNVDPGKVDVTPAPDADADANEGDGG